jgi:hypothetical protein
VSKLLTRLRDDAVRFAEHELVTVEEVRPVLTALLSHLERTIGVPEAPEPGRAVDNTSPPAPVAPAPGEDVFTPAADQTATSDVVTPTPDETPTEPIGLEPVGATPLVEPLTADELNQLAELDRRARAAGQEPPA